jgi:hypothetical protein
MTRRMNGMPHTGTPIAETYLEFAEAELAGNCAVYEALCRGIAADPAVLRLIEDLPLPKRQPNLILAATRWHDAPLESYPDYREWTLAHWDAVRETAMRRRTQTNEPGRMRVIAPVLARLPQPLALLEVGASAGLCLYPDRVVDPTLRVAWRAGIDLNPLDINDPDHVRWLECLVWPSQPDRLERLRRTIDVARAEPPLLVQGDLTTDLDPLIARAPADATLVVFHTAVLAYVEPLGRKSFADRMSTLDGHWISNEAPGVMHDMPAPPGRCVLALDGTPIAFTAPHGQSVTWL